MSHAIIKTLALGPMDNFTYLVGDGAICAVIDPGWETDKIIKAATSEGWKIDAILLTHGHFDHAHETGSLAKKTHAKIYVHRDEEIRVSKDVVVERTEDESLIRIGKIELKCIHTPGHTQGSQCFLVDNSLFTGDTLFVDACGRVDLPGSSPKQMEDSLKRISKLKPSIVIYPGHNYGDTPTSTIGEQLKTNPYL